MLKWIAILLNLGVLGFLAYIVFEEGIPEIDDPAFWFLALLAGAAGVNFLHIFLARPSPPSGDDENILELWLRVKKAELRKRLADLS